MREGAILFQANSLIPSISPSLHLSISPSLHLSVPPSLHLCISPSQNPALYLLNRTQFP